ncbi:MAG TPA: hypothetical protein VFQ92_22330 [Blastocatellia bacterium]|nr:hypothetical protein [Blastocatellia bacterium]
MSEESDRDDSKDPLDGLRLRDEVLQVMYWMTGEGFGRDFAPADIQKFLPADDAALVEALEQMILDGLIEKTDRDQYALTVQGKIEGGRRFADEFEGMMKPGHFECDEPDCDCHNADSIGECKNLSPAHSTLQHS